MKKSVETLINGFKIYIDNKLDKMRPITPDETIDFISEMGYIKPMITDSNIIYTDKNNKIYIL